MANIYITDTISIDENEIEETFIRSSGPGGQNVNKVSTTAQIRFNVKDSHSLPEEIKMRLIRFGASRITDEGVLIINGERPGLHVRRSCVVWKQNVSTAKRNGIENLIQTMNKSPININLFQVEQI